MARLDQTTPEQAKKRTKRWIVLFCVVAAVVLVCVLLDTFTDYITPSKVTAQEFESLQSGMTEQEMLGILTDGYKTRRMQLNQHAQQETTYVYSAVGEGGREVTLFFLEGKLEWKMHNGILGEILPQNTKLS